MRLYQGDERERERERERDRQRERQRETETETETDRQAGRQTGRQTGRQRQTRRQRRWREMGAGAIKLHCLVVSFNRQSFSDDQFWKQRRVAEMRQGIPTFHCSVSVLTIALQGNEKKNRFVYTLKHTHTHTPKLLFCTRTKPSLFSVPTLSVIMP